MASVISAPSATEQTPPKSHSNQMFTSFLNEFYSDNTANYIKRNDSYIENKMKSKQYHLKNNSSHINTVTNLGSPMGTVENIESRQSINTFLNDFNEFHRAQDINHRKRLSKYENQYCIPVIPNPGDKNNQVSPKLKIYSPKKHIKRFSIYSIKQLKLLNNSPKGKGHSKNSSISSSSSSSRNSYSRGSDKKKILIKRKKSISYKSLFDSRKNIPLFRTKSKLYSVSAFAHKNNEEKLTKTEIFEIITKERLKVLNPSSELSQILFKRIKYDSYKKDHRLVNYSSDINLRSKYDSEQVTKTELDRTVDLWQQYLTNLISNKIKENLSHPSKLSPIFGVLAKDENTDKVSMKANLSDIDSNNSYLSETSSELSSVLEQKINQFINKNRQHVSYATTIANTQFSQNNSGSEDDIDEFEWIRKESK